MDKTNLKRIAIYVAGCLFLTVICIVLVLKIFEIENKSDALYTNSKTERINMENKIENIDTIKEEEKQLKANIEEYSKLYIKDQPNEDIERIFTNKITEKGLEHRYIIFDGWKYLDDGIMDENTEKENPSDIWDDNETKNIDENIYFYAKRVQIGFEGKLTDILSLIEEINNMYAVEVEKYRIYGDNDEYNCHMIISMKLMKEYEIS